MNECFRDLACCKAESGAFVRLNAHPRVHREAAVLVGQHLFGVTALQQAAAHESAQDALAQIGLRPRRPSQRYWLCRRCVLVAACPEITL